MPQIYVEKRILDWQRITGVAIAVLIVTAIVVFAAVLNAQKPDTKAATKAIILNAQDKAFSNDYDGAITLLKAQLKSASTDEEKLSIHTAIGSNYESKKDFQSALAEFKQSQAIAHTYGTDMSVARAAEEAADNATALANYRLCYQGIKDGTYKGHYGDLSEVQVAITRVGGTP